MTAERPTREARLHARRAEAAARALALAVDLAAVHEASRDSNADDEHDPEGATIAFERQQLVALLEQAHADVHAADRALARAASTDAGRCESCHGPIGEGRLEARPTATRCVACAASSAGRTSR